MSNHNSHQSPAEKSAQKMFRSAAQNAPAKQNGKSERALTAAKTARLRGLRLAMEKVEQEAAEKRSSEQGESKSPPPARRKRATAVKAAPMVRMIY